MYGVFWVVRCVGCLVLVVVVFYAEGQRQSVLGAVQFHHGNDASFKRIKRCRKGVRNQFRLLCLLYF